MLHHVKGWFLSLKGCVDTYRRWEYKGIYCNIRYTYEYLCLPIEAFSDTVLVKDNTVEIFDKELS